MGTDPDGSLRLILICTAILFIILNGLFSAADSAINTINRTKLRLLIEEEEDKRAQIVSDLLDDPMAFLVSVRCMNAITCSLVLMIACGLFWRPLDSALSSHIGMHWLSALLTSIIILLVVVIIVMVFCHIYPRKFAIQHSESVSIRLVRPAMAAVAVLSPLTGLITLLGNAFLRITGQNTDAVEEFSEDEIKELLEVGQETGQLKEEGKNMINSIFAFDDKLAYEIMTPRPDVFMIDIDEDENEYMDELMEMTYTRIPVYEGDSDNIIGILNIKDYLIQAHDTGFENVDIRSILRKPYFVPETKNIDSLFFELQKTKQHIAVLIDEYGGFSGIVTMEDIIEEVMGDIDDEYDEEERSIEMIDDNNFIIGGNADLDDINEELDLELESENSETLGGYLIDILGEIPEENEKTHRIIEEDDLIFEILSVKDRRIEQVKVTRKVS